MRMMEQTKAFPKKVNIDQYKAVIDAALTAAVGSDGLPKVVIEDYDTAKLAVKAANAIRNYTKNRVPRLKVSCPDGSKSIYVYRTDEPARTRKKKTAVEASSTVETPTTESVPAGE